MKYLILILSLVSFNVQAQFYVEAGVGMTDEINSQPEIFLTNPLGKFTIGYYSEYNWSVEFEHISSIQLDEEGTGLNTFWITKRVWIR